MKLAAKMLEKYAHCSNLFHRSEETDILEVDSAIQGFDGVQLVFTDITFGVHDRDRFIVVR